MHVLEHALALGQLADADLHGALRDRGATAAREDRRVVRRLRFTSLIVSGTGDVIEPEDGLVAIGSGGPFALSAARALLAHTGLDAKAVATEALKIAGDICIYTNGRSEEHTSELQSLIRISYAVFCLKKKIKSISLLILYYNISISLLIHQLILSHD